MIEFDQVSLHYPGGQGGLSDVSFRLARGELAVLSGHSGAGKTSLLKLIAAIERPSSGKVTVGGEDVGALPRQAIPYLRRNIGLVLQEIRLLLDRNVFDNVLLPLTITGHPPSDASRRVQAALERVGLGGRGDEMPLALSGGEQQRVAIARAVVNRPSILVADEPTAHLDADYAGDIAALFRSFHAAGVTVLIATHDSSLFDDATPRRLVMSHGRLSEVA